MQKKSESLSRELGFDLSPLELTSKSRFSGSRLGFRRRQRYQLQVSINTGSRSELTSTEGGKATSQVCPLLQVLEYSVLVGFGQIPKPRVENQAAKATP